MERRAPVRDRSLRLTFDQLPWNQNITALSTSRGVSANVLKSSR